MSLPFSKFVSISASVVKPAFSLEKKHLMLALDTSLLPASNSIVEVTSLDLPKLTVLFGLDSKEVGAIKKYFSYMSKSGTSADKLIIARWFKDASPATIYADGTEEKDFSKIKELKGSFKLSINNKTIAPEVNFKSANSFSDVASIIQSAIISASGIDGNADFTKATVKYISSVGFVITSGVAGKNKTMSLSKSGTVDILTPLGLGRTIDSAGVDSESYAEFIERIYNANTAAFSIMTLEDLEIADMVNASKFLSFIQDGQTVNTKIKLIFNIFDLDKAKDAAQELNQLGVSGYTVTYDPYHELVGVFDGAIGAAIDFELPNSAVNFNFQRAKGYTPITKFNTVHDFQAGITDSSFTKDLDDLKISYVYSVGIGKQEIIFYGLGLMAGDFGSEDIQINESWLESELQTGVMNAFNSLSKIPLQGRSSKEIIGLCVVPAFKKGIANGAIAAGGVLSDNDKMTLNQSFGADSISALESSGYFYTVLNPTADDIKNRRLQVKYAYLASGVVNKVRIVASVYGA